MDTGTNEANAISHPPPLLATVTPPPAHPTPDEVDDGYRKNGRRSRRVPGEHGESPQAARKPAEAAGRKAPDGSRQPPVGTQSGSASVCRTHSAGGAPALPAASTPPTIAQVVSTSPPTWAVVQNADA